MRYRGDFLLGTPGSPEPCFDSHPPAWNRTLPKITRVTFVGALVAVDISRAVAILFVLAMFAVIASLSMFLREVYLAVSAGGHRI
jgi:hypothetical protein